MMDRMNRMDEWNRNFFFVFEHLLQVKKQNYRFNRDSELVNGDERIP